MAFEVTTSLRKMLAMKARKKVVQGATSSGKTYGIIPIIYDKLIEFDRFKATIVAETLPAVKEGAVDIFQSFMEETNRWNDSYWNASTLTYTRPNKSKLQFKSFDSVGKAKASGKRDLLFLNEANHIPFEIADALMTRSNDIWMDFNADTEFWAHTEILTQPNSEFLKLTYKDNEAIPPQILEELMLKKAKSDAEEKAGMKGYWWNWWQVYGLGEIGNLQGAIFNNYSLCDFVPDEASLVAYGCDFGYTNDPTTLTAIYYMDGKYYLDELIYQKGLTNSDLNNLMQSLEVNKRVEIYADSAEPKSIAELKRYGWKMTPAIKGKDSINFGIQEMQKEQFFVTNKSLNLINELRKYMWKVDREGKATNTPIDAFNHCFIGSTIITTSQGRVEIKDVNIGDYVLTSQGWKRVLKKFDNGYKLVNKYSMQFDTFSVSLCSTKEHKIKTEKGWRAISGLQREDVLYQYKYSTERNINCMMARNILVEALKDYIQRYGNTIKEKYLKGIMFIMLTGIATTTILAILILLVQSYILGMRVKKGLKKTLSGLKTFILKVLRKQKNGTNQKRVKSGIANMVKKYGLTKNIGVLIVRFVEKNIKQGIQEYQNTAIKTAKLKHLEIGESKKEKVYDLMIEDCHEYFANGILVHNCVDGIRYYFQNKAKPKAKAPRSRMV